VIPIRLPAAKADAPLTTPVIAKIMMVYALTLAKKITFAAVTNVGRMVVAFVLKKKNRVLPVTFAAVV
jgi:hypothetical protein